MKKAASNMCTFLIVTTLAATITTVSCTNPAPQEEEKLQIPFIAGNIGNEIAECWSLITGVEGCVSDILNSFSSLQNKMGPECCNAIAGIGDNCFSAIFIPFGPSFAPLLKSFCDAIPNTNPLPVIAAAPADH